MKEIVSIITKVIVVILADGFTVFAKRMSFQLQQTYSQTSGYISNLVWIILLGILFIISIRVCNVEKKIYKILFLLFLAANVVYIIYSIRYYGVMTLGLFVSITYMIDLMRSVQTNK